MSGWILKIPMDGSLDLAAAPTAVAATIAMACVDLDVLAGLGRVEDVDATTGAAIMTIIAVARDGGTLFASRQSGPWFARRCKPLQDTYMMSLYLVVSRLQRKWKRIAHFIGGAVLSCVMVPVARTVRYCVD